ncbi:MAG: hypothetical protein JJT88_07270 [Gammaproteobacteria bacterium]|nr:hypothetical protein [Gammaproteobacteria bacterium]
MKIDQKLQAWIDARKRYGLSHAQVQMARELGLNPKKLGSLANTKQQPWKAPLPVFIEQIYAKQFKRSQPESVISIEERARLQAEKKAARREAKRQARASSDCLWPAGE